MNMLMLMASLCADLKQDVRLIVCWNALGHHCAVVVWLTHQDRR